jgi:hypothetical protein
MYPIEMIECLKRLEKKIDLLKEEIAYVLKKDVLHSGWISESEVRALTGLSRNTLLKLRQDGKILRSTISGKKNFYRIDDFKKLLDKNQGE